MVFFVGCVIALAAGFFGMRVFRKEEAIILSLLVAITAGVGGILLVIFVVAPNLEWSPAMKVVFPLLGGIGAIARLFWDRRNTRRKEG